MKRLTFLLPAEQEMTEAAAYYEARADGLGKTFLDRVQSAVQALVENPAACPFIRGPVRRKLVARFPYGVLYRDDPDEIVILAVMHLRRQPDYWVDRM